MDTEKGKETAVLFVPSKHFLTNFGPVLIKIIKIKRLANLSCNGVRVRVSAGPDGAQCPPPRPASPPGPGPITVTARQSR